MVFFCHTIDTIMHLSMLSPRRGGPRAYVGHLTSVPFPTLGNLTKNLGPREGTFAFFARRNRTKSHHSMCLCVFRATIKALKDFSMEVSTSFYVIQKHYFSLLIFNIN